jgi:WD40 repeat protein
MAGFGEKRGTKNGRDDEYEQAFLTNPKNQPLLRLIKSSKQEPGNPRRFDDFKAIHFTTKDNADYIKSYKKPEYVPDEEQDTHEYILTSSLLRHATLSLIDRGPNTILSVAINNRGNIAAGCENGIVYYIEKNGRITTIHKLDAYGAGARDVEINAVAFSFDGGHIFAGGNDGIIRIWDSQNRTVQAIIRNNGIINTIAVYPQNNGRFISGDENGAIRVWDITTMNLLQTLMHPNPGEPSTSVRCIAFNPSGTNFASGGDDGIIKIWDGETLTMLGTMTDSSQTGIKAIIYASDDIVVSGDIAGKIHIWNAKNGNLLRTIREFGMPINSIALLQQNIVAIAYEYWGSRQHGNVRVYNVDNASLMQELDVGLPANSLAIGPTGQIVAGGREGFLIVASNEPTPDAKEQAYALMQGTKRSDELYAKRVENATNPSLKSSSAAAAMHNPSKSSVARLPVSVDEKLFATLERFPNLPDEAQKNVTSYLGGKRNKRRRKTIRKRNQTRKKRTSKRR